MAKPGPRTEHGKAIVRFNATQHGIFSTSPVIPGLEREEDWEALRLGVLESEAPVGHTEAELAERVAHLLWRLKRVERYELGSITTAQELVEDDWEPSRPLSLSTSVNRGGRIRPDDVRFELELRRERVQILERLLELPDDSPVCAEKAADVVRYAADTARNVSVDDVDIPGLPAGEALDTFAGWTAGLLRGAVRAIAERAGRRMEDLLIAALRRAQTEMRSAQRNVDRLAADLDRMRRQRLLPDEDTANKVVRYEAHLDRRLYHALHELEARQARRRGTSAPLARVDVHGLPEK